MRMGIRMGVGVGGMRIKMKRIMGENESENEN